MSKFRDIQMRFSKGQFLTATTLWIFYFVALSFVYCIHVVRWWGYQGFESDFNTLRFAISVLVILFFCICVRSHRKTVAIVASLTQGVVLVPSLVLFCNNHLAWKFFAITLLGSFLLLAAASFFPVRTIRAPKLAAGSLVRILSIGALLNLFLIIIFVGFKNINFDLFRVYEFRELINDSMPSALGYFNAFTTRAALPFIMVLGLRDSNYRYVMLAVGISVAFFAFTANRLPLFQPLLIWGLYFLLGRSLHQLWLSVAFLILTIAGLLSFQLNESGTPPAFGTLVIYRGILVPMLANWQYFDFFGTFGDFYFWSQSKLSLGLVAAPDKLPMINLIGAEYWKGSQVAANVGWLGSGYGQAGVFGVSVYSLLFGAVIAVVQGYTKIHGFRVAVTLMLMPIIVGLTTADFVTLFLSQGLLASLVLLIVLKPSGTQQPLVAAA